jgi:hypothetical protein
MRADYADYSSQTSHEGLQKDDEIIARPHVRARSPRRRVIPLRRDHCENLPQNRVKQLQDRSRRENFLLLGHRIAERGLTKFGKGRLWTRL